MLLLLFHKKEEEVISTAVAEWNCAMQTSATVVAKYGSNISIMSQSMYHSDNVSGYMASLYCSSLLQCNFMASSRIGHSLSTVVLFIPSLSCES